MDYKALRFMGYYVHEKGPYESALATATAEIESRKSGNASDETFKIAAQKFHDDHKLFGEGLIARAEKGERVEHIELLTLARAEKLYATTVVDGRQSKLHENLADGFNLRGKQNGLSMTERVARLTGMESPIEKIPAHLRAHPSSGVTISL